MRQGSDQDQAAKQFPRATGVAPSGGTALRASGSDWAVSVGNMTDARAEADDESRELWDGTFFKRVLRSYMVLVAFIAGSAAAAFKTRSTVRLTFSAIALALSGLLAWSAMVTGLALVGQRVLRQHHPQEDDTSAT